MSEQGKNLPSSGKDNGKLSQKEIREERLKKSLRANLQRRKAKMRAIKSAEGSNNGQN